MAEPQHETLSRLMDGELDADQAEAAIDAVCRDEALTAQWRRLHQVRGLICGDVDRPFDVSDAVRNALASEPAYLLPAIAPPRSLGGWQRFAMGGALAASVALITILGLRQWQTPAEPSQLAAAADAGLTRVAADAAAQKKTPAAQPSRLESYWAVHAGNALLAGQESLAPSIENVRADDRR